MRYIISPTPPAEVGDITLSASHADIGDQLTITGSGFGYVQGSSAVWFGELPQYTFSDGFVARPCTKEAASYVSWSDTEIVVTVPSMSPGLAGATGTYHNVYVEVGGVPTTTAAFYIDPVTTLDASSSGAAWAAVFPNSTVYVEDHTYTNSSGEHASQHASYTTHVRLSCANDYANYVASGSHNVLIKDAVFEANSTNINWSDSGIITLGSYQDHTGNISCLTFHNCVILNNTADGALIEARREGVNGVKVYHDYATGRYGDFTFSDCSFGTPNSPTGAFRRGSLELVEPVGGISYNYTTPNYIQNVHLTGCDFEPCGWHTGFSFAFYCRGPERGMLVENCTFKGNALATSWNRVNGMEMSGKGLVMRDCELWGGVENWFSPEGYSSDSGQDYNGEYNHMYFKNLTCDFTHRYGSAANTGWTYACNEREANGMVWEDCDFNFGDASNSLVGWNYRPDGTGACVDTDWSTSYFHGHCRRSNSSPVEPATVYGYYTDWVTAEASVAAAYAGNNFDWPHLGTRP